jgi:hypothetical protein
MSVEEIYKFQRRIRSFNINEVMREQIPSKLVYVEYTEGKYSHYLDDKHLNDFLKFLCLYYQTKSLWYAIDFDGTLFTEFKLKE